MPTLLAELNSALYHLAEAQAECGPFEESGAAVALSELLDDAMEVTKLARQRVETIITSPGPLPTWVRDREMAAARRPPRRARAISRKRPRRAA